MNYHTPQERMALAVALNFSDAYLYQCLTGRRELAPQQAVDLERRSGGRLRRWQLCQKTWHLIWPELIGTAGAPAVTANGVESGGVSAPAEQAEELSHVG